MNYELALKLKKAGFPQSLKTGDELISSDESGGDMVKNPTLSELIEACDNKFVRLEKFPKRWDVVGHVKWDQAGTVSGNTPKEAVANLWLKLND